MTSLVSQEEADINRKVIVALLCPYFRRATRALMQFEHAWKDYPCIDVLHECLDRVDQ